MNTILINILRIAILGIFFTSIWYVSYRLRVMFGLTRRWHLRIAVTIVFFGSIVMMLSGAKSTSPFIGVLNIVGGYVFTFYVLLTILLLVVHVIQLKWELSGKKTALTTITLAIAITAGGALWANPFEVNEVEIPMEKLGRDVVVMHISDVHIGHHRGKDYLAKIVKETNHYKPDMVLINGDLVDSNAALLPGVLSPLEDFEAPVFFTNGNHDNYVDTDRVFELITKHGARILHNEVVDINGIYLLGLDYMNPDENTFDMHPSEDKRTIKGVLPTIPLKDDKPSVLMHHSPVGVQYVTAKGIDLMLSGHTHAGQMFPGTILMKIFFPFNKGLYKKENTTVFVSQGAGTFGTRIRLGTSNKINLIRLKAIP